MKSLFAHFLNSIAAVALVALLCEPTAAVVVDVDASAGDTQTYYSNWGPNNANAANPAPNSYNNYRKGGVDSPPGLPTAADGGDGITGIWSNVSHNGANSAPCCGNPGMFFGQSPSATSYADAQLFLRSNLQGNGNGEHGDNQNNGGDGHRKFDLRIGFTESPADWIAGKGASTGEWDMWTGDHGSDTVYISMQQTATVIPTNLWRPILNRDLAVNPGDAETNQMVTVKNDLFAQAGGTSGLPDEGSRDSYYRNSSGVGQGKVTAHDNFDGQDYELDAVGLWTDPNGWFDTGVGYGGNVPVTWGMELNDPGNADPALARQVKFKIQFGDVEFAQVFDPGAADDAMIPNPIGDVGNAFTDGFFDWQNAYPVFFIGPGGGADNATVTMGFTNPDTCPDCDGDGDVDGQDFLIQQRDDPSGIADWEAAYPSPLGASAGASAVPEPSTMLLAVLTLLGVGGATRRR